MSFGFSVGDFIAVGTLIADISSYLAESGGSKSQYQELLRELESLQQALVHLDKLQLGDSSSANLDSIKYAALSCRRPLEDFLVKIKKYDTSLGVWSQEGPFKSAASKLGWAYRQKEHIRKLQSYLNIHVGTINILLAEHGLEVMKIASEKVEAGHLNIRERLDDTRTVVNWIRDNVSAQALAIKFTNSMLSSLFNMITGEFGRPLMALEEMVAKVCVSTQQIYSVVLEIKSSLAFGDTRWTYFQAPLIVEDALGFKFPVPSEYDFELLDTIIKHRFLNGPGSLDVKAGNYELFKAKNSKQVLSASVRLIPGTSITMAILVSKPELTEHTCPMPLCRSTRSTAVLGGGRLCSECNVWFDKSDKRRISLQDLLDVIDQQDTVPGARKRKLDQDSAPRKRARTSGPEEHYDSFRNVRWSLEDGNSHGPTSEDEISDGATSEDGISENGSESSEPQLPIIEHALAYLDQIKIEFSDQPEIYDQYLGIMKAFKERKLDTEGVVDQVNRLFVGHGALIQGFKLFLPPIFTVYCLLLSAAAFDGHLEKPNYFDPGLRHGLEFAAKVQTRFHDDPHIYQGFLSILQTYAREKMSLGKLSRQVGRLFGTHKDLCIEFQSFFPEAYKRLEV